jgi:hypothetical protein
MRIGKLVIYYHPKYEIRTVLRVTNCKAIEIRWLWKRPLIFIFCKKGGD